MIFRIFSLLFVCFGFFVDSVCANDQDSISIQVGIENAYKNGLWTPLSVKSPQSILTLDVKCSDSDGTPITYHYEIAGKDSTDNTTARVLVKLGRKNEPLQIAVNGGSFQTFDVPPPVNAEKPIYLIFGNEDIGLQGAVAELALRTDRRPLLVHVKSFADLPEKWFGYEAVEMVVLTTTNPQLFQGFTTESLQIQALNDWLKLGGKMLLCAGKNAGQFLEPENGFLRLFLPGQFSEMTEMRSSSPFELFVKSKRQIFMNGTDEAPFMKMPRFTDPQGITLVKDGDLPLVLRSAHGLGTLIYFGGDLSEKPISNWRDRSALVRNIMQWNTEKRTAVTPRSGAMLQLGYNDISGQIRSALDKFEEVRIVPFSLILIILTVYWLVVGLFDWFFVHKVLQRPMLTWVTFPLWILLFSVLAYVLAAPGRPTARTLSNDLILHDVDEQTGVSRFSIWQNQYNPIDKRSTISLETNPSETSGYMSWNGLPGSGLGGMAPKTVSPTIWKIGSQQKSYTEISNVPFQTRSTKSFFGQNYSRSEDEDMRITSQLSDEEGIPIGTLMVPAKFPFAMKNSIMVYGRWILELGEITPGQKIDLTKTTQRQELRNLLIPPKVIADTVLRGLATYNLQSSDLEYIVRVMSLHHVLGGYEATGLHHSYVQSLDMSSLLTADRVILLGTVKNKDVISNDKKTNYVTSIYRYSFPIKLTELSPRLNIERQEIVPDELEQGFRPEFIRDPSGERL